RGASAPNVATARYPASPVLGLRDRPGATSCRCGSPTCSSPPPGERTSIRRSRRCVHDPPEGQGPPFESVHQCADAVSAAADDGRRRAARRRPSGLSRIVLAELARVGLPCEWIPINVSFLFSGTL